MSQYTVTRGSSTQDLRPVSSSVHQGQPCQPCILCRRANLSKYFLPKSWKDDSHLQKLRELEPSLNIKPESCICRNCRQDVSCLGESGVIPRWRKINNPDEIEKQCYVSQCNEHECKITTLSECKITTLSDKATICSLFGMDIPNPEPFETASSNEGIPLCIYHYGVLYLRSSESIPLKVCHM